MGVTILARVLMNPSNPRMNPRRWDGTHLNSIVGIVGPYKETPTKYIAAIAAKIAKLGWIRIDPDAAKPNNRRLDPVRVNPLAHVNTGPIDFKILVDIVVDTRKLIQARHVNNKPISFVTIP